MNLPRVVPGQVWESTRRRSPGRQIVVVASDGVLVKAKVLQPHRTARLDYTGRVVILGRWLIHRENRLVQDV